MTEGWANLPGHWRLSRLDRVASVNARIGWKALTAAEYQPDGYVFLATPNIKNEQIEFDNVNYISKHRYDESPELKLRPGDVLLVKDGNTLGITNIVRDLPRPATVNGSIAVIRPFGIDSRFLRYILASDYIQGRISAMRAGMGVPHLFQWDIKRFPIPLPPLEEQRRIADFLDTETFRIDRLIKLRREQGRLLRARFCQLVDGATAGDANAVSELGCPHLDNWVWMKISQVCHIIPGYAFPSEGFVRESDGVRLLRGVNVDVGKIDWSDTVAWSVATNPIPDRFYLRDGDLVMGMDRPWISRGLRLAIVRKADLPALLLQRVACLRAKVDVSVEYVRRVLDSSYFRHLVETDMTGVSVPHLSGGQIGGFVFRLPSRKMQDLIAKALDEKAKDATAVQAAANRQCGLLKERRQALITAAVTGQLDVTTARSRVRV